MESPERLSALNVAQTRETLLVVDDDYSLLSSINDVLESLGYRVLCAVDGDEAMERCEEAAGPLDLVLTDVVMPQTNGYNLVEVLAPMHPGIKVLYMSGCLGEEVFEGFQCNFIAKPFSPRELDQKIRELLDAPAADSEEKGLVPVSTPDAPDAARLYREGSASLARDDIWDAVQFLQGAVAMQPEVADYQAKLGEALAHKRGWLQRAEAAIKRALALDPDHESALTTSALLHSRSGRHQDAEQALRRVLEANPESQAAMEQLKQLETCVPQQ